MKKTFSGQLTAPPQTLPSGEWHAYSHTTSVPSAARFDSSRTNLTNPSL